MIAAALSDTDLLAQAREGDESAFTELYVRHQAAALRLAKSYRRAGDPDDLVNSSFERVIAAIRRGAGPTEAFRAYLFVTLRRLAAEQISKGRDDPYDEIPEPVQAEADGPEFDRSDRELVIQAYESLPDRWQAVLWQTTVEGHSPKELAPALGMSANAAAALAYRAREKLRQAYLQAHLQAAPRPGCEPHRSRLGAYVRDGLSNRDRTSAEQHLEGCGSCRSLVAELVDINAVLNRAILPLFLAAGTEIGAAAAGAGAGAAAGGVLKGGPALWARKGVSKARNNPTGSVVAAAALLAALLAGLIAASGPEGDNAPPDAASPTEEATAPPAGGGESPPSPEPEPEPPAPEPTTRSTPAEPEPEPPDPAPEPEPEGDDLPLRVTTTTVEPTTTQTPPEPQTTTTQTTEPEPQTTTTTAPPPPVPTGPVVWNASNGTVDITLTNTDDVPTDYMLLNVSLSGGALTLAGPAGCDLPLSLVITAECGLNPIGPGQTRVVQLPVLVTGSGQTATVSQCQVGLLSYECDSPILRRSTVNLD